eukprot:gene1175-biopygen3259
MSRCDGGGGGRGWGRDDSVLPVRQTPLGAGSSLRATLYPKAMGSGAQPLLATLLGKEDAPSQGGGGVRAHARAARAAPAASLPRTHMRRVDSTRDSQEVPVLKRSGIWGDHPRGPLELGRCRRTSLNPLEPLLLLLLLLLILFVFSFFFSFLFSSFSPSSSPSSGSALAAE